MVAKIDDLGIHMVAESQSVQIKFDEETYYKLGGGMIFERD
ncbi:hypothetical protein [Staphylococcus epidermidis]|nr:hypothetical protein [Staphylococcus epidermidis]